jgi:hypothetical protein
VSDSSEQNENNPNQSKNNNKKNLLDYPQIALVF